ncbi:MAG: hypothetical protein II251_01730 [Lachnospiraceae bacterium]|nr:hypothetical protein [Lachnospiraceae bacterium]
MKKRLTNNFSMKIISFVLAILFWLVIASIEDPETTKNFTVPVTKINEELVRESDKTYEVTSGNTVAITVRARQSILSDLTAEDFKAVADFANLSFTGAIPIEVSVLHHTNHVEITKGANTMMQVSIEELASVDKVVSTKAEGSVITGKALGTITVEPNMIRMEGAKTTIDRIASVYAVVNVSGSSEDSSHVVEPIVYDSNGDIIDTTDILFSVDSLTVNVTLLDTKTVPVEWNIDVTAADGYGIESKDYTPSEIQVAGSEEALNAISKVVLDDYVAYDLTEGVEYEADLESIVKDRGVSIVNPEENRNVKLAVRVAPYDQKSGTVEFDAIELKGKNSDYKYSVSGDTSITYALSGLSTDLEILDDTKLDFILDVTGLEPGNHTLNLKLETSQRVQLTSDISVKIRIDEK